MDPDATELPSGVLSRFGVSDAAEAVWLRLLEAPQRTAMQVRELAKLSASEYDAAIEALFAAQLVRGGPTPTGVATIDPTLAIEAQIARAEREAAKQVAAFAALRAQLPQLASLYSQGRLDAGEQPGFEVVVPVEDIRQLTSLAASRVRSDVRSIEHGPPEFDIAEDNELELSLLRRGVRDRLILDADAVVNPNVFETYLSWQKHGHRTRTLPRLYHRVIVYDDELAVLPVDPALMSHGAIFIRVRTVINLLSLIYDHLWTIATPLFDEPEETGAPRGRPARILELLAIGNTDQRIARTLGVGERTIRREVADLKTSLGVNSRTELSAAAIRKGWI